MNHKVLQVCRTLPADISADGTCLSFMSPSDEDRLESENPTLKIFRGRKIVQDIQAQAREAYIRIVAQIGIADCRGITFRKALEHKGVCLWWFHPVSAKNCEHDPTFNKMLEIFAIKHTAESLNTRNIHCTGISCDVVEVLKNSGFEVTGEAGSKNILHLTRTIISSLLKRGLKALHEIVHILALRKLQNNMASAQEEADVALAGYWNWSLDYDSDGHLKDRYFGDLPDTLEKTGIRVNRLVWIDSRKRIPNPKYVSSLIAPLGRGKNIAVLQAFLRCQDIIKQFFNFRPLATYLLRVKNNSLQQACTFDSLDFRALFTQRMLEGFLDWSIPHGFCVYTAAKSAFRKVKPRTLVTFQEHYLHSKALYSACRVEKIRSATIQHASYNHNKIFLFFDPEIEFNGKPDGMSIPRPDTVFAMGEFGRSLFLECGYAPENVIVTGSTRYCSGQQTEFPSPKRQDGSTHILIVCTLDHNTEMEMIEAAWHAVQDLPEIKLKVRSHPDRPIHLLPAFAPFKDRIKPTTHSLEEDLEQCDVVLFTFTTVAEEAYTRSKPVIQWQPLGYNGSALAEAADIPTFSTISEMKHFFKSFINRKIPLPPDEAGSEVLDKLFNNMTQKSAHSISQLLLTS